MKKRSKKTIGLLLVIILCFSMIPLSASATDSGIVPDMNGQATENTGEEAPEVPGGANEEIPNDEPGMEPADEEPAEVPGDEVQGNIEIEPELVKTVSAPLVSVVYNYYDADANGSAENFSDYTLESFHSYHAIAQAGEAGISIPANKYPGKVAVSTEALRFRVLMNAGTDVEADITGVAGYSAETGMITLPDMFMGHQITIMWYCPTSEIVELPVNVTVCVYENGEYTTTTETVNVASNANIGSVALNAVDNLVLSQNGIDLDESMYSVDGSGLNISAPALGGDIAVTAYTAVMRAMSGGISTMGATTQVSHTRSSSQIYYGYYTSYYTANGNTAFCLDPTVSGLNAGTYDVSGYLSRGTGYDDLIKAAYYLYGGPSYDSVKAALFGDPDSMEAYGLCHAAVAYMWLDNPSAFMGLSSATRDHLLRVIDSVNAQAMPPESFEVFLYNVGSNTNQSLISWEYTPTGNLEIQKVSGDTDKTDGNSCYSLQDAVFGVYNGNDEKIGSITTDAAGKGKLEGIAAGQTGLYILEEKPPAGYAEHKGKIPFEIVSGQTTTKVIENVPQGDPTYILLEKVDADTGKPVPQGNADFSGAEFLVEYYKGYFTENELKNEKPARAWVFSTDEDGYACLDPAYLVSGDALYYDSTGKFATLPLGTIRIVEQSPPTSGLYKLNPTVYVRQVTSEGVVEPVYTYNEPEVPEPIIRGGVTILKLDDDLLRPEQAQGSATVKNATFNIINRSKNDVVVAGKTYKPGETVYTGQTNANGVFSTPNASYLPGGRYEVSEPANGAPNGYLNEGKLSQIFDIEKDGVMVDLTDKETSIVNKVKRGGVVIWKMDDEIARNESQGSGTLEGAVFHITNMNSNPVVVDDVEYAPGEVWSIQFIYSIMKILKSIIVQFRFEKSKARIK